MGQGGCVKRSPGVPPACGPVPSSPMSMMSLSPTTSTSNYDETPSTKRRRTTSFTAAANGGPRSEMASPQDSPSGHGASSSVAAAHIPKRGARACTNCRKGKNRCEGEVRTLHLSRLAAGCLPVARPSPSRLPAHPPGPGCSLPGSVSTLPTERRTVRV